LVLLFNEVVVVLTFVVLRLLLVVLLVAVLVELLTTTVVLMLSASMLLFSGNLSAGSDSFLGDKGSIVEFRDDDDDDDDDDGLEDGVASDGAEEEVVGVGEFRFVFLYTLNMGRTARRQVVVVEPSHCRLCR
jgi:hypothetical protein